jgi:pimeloyl-ACP methyl ester carboxylesterase
MDPALESGYVQAASLRLHHTHAGEGDPPVLLVHGLGSAGYMEWRYTLPALARHRRVYAPDLPGFGRSEKGRLGYGVPLFVRSVESYARAVGLDRVDLVGASLGGRVAIELAIRRPRWVRRLVLVNSLGVVRPKVQVFHPLVALPGVGEGVIRLVGEGLRRLPPSQTRYLARRYGGVSEATLSDQAIADMREVHATPGYGAAYAQTVRSLARPELLLGTDELLDRLARTGVPVQLIWGALDTLFPLRWARQASRRLPGSRLTVIDRAGHSPQAERPDRFNLVLGEFLGLPGEEEVGDSPA